MVWPRKNIFAEYTQPVPPRFYVPEARDEESVVELPEDEATHLTRVLRLAGGDAVRVFDGRGAEWDARVELVARRRVSVRLHSRVAATAESRLVLTLAVAVLKGDKMDSVIRDAVMLGATTIAPLVTTRTEVSRAAIERAGRVARWQRIAVSSAKQSGRAVVPEVQPVATFDACISHAAYAVMMVEPAATVAAVSLRELKPPPGGELTLLVGPEGGWTNEEVQQGRASGAMLLRLGAQTLRADAVPLVGLTAVRVQLEDF
jgi:16S rRNA (uracil1498-N3)-methyltransferase